MRIGIIIMAGWKHLLWDQGLILEYLYLTRLQIVNYKIQNQEERITNIVKIPGNCFLVDKISGVLC
jgi:hypothetical protein